MRIFLVLGAAFIALLIIVYAFFGFPIAESQVAEPEKQLAEIKISRLEAETEFEDNPQIGDEAIVKKLKQKKIYRLQKEQTWRRAPPPSIAKNTETFEPKKELQKIGKVAATKAEANAWVIDPIRSDEQQTVCPEWQDSCIPNDQEGIPVLGVVLRPGSIGAMKGEWQSGAYLEKTPAIFIE